MSRKSGRTSRFISRWFKERQIYHRSDGVVHFISMSTKTQIALASVVGAALLWVAYASVNVVFKEQIIVAKERDRRVMETSYSSRLLDQKDAYNDVASLNVILQKEFDATMADLSGRHQTLQTMVERKAAIDESIDGLAAGLSEAGSPKGKKPVNGNRIMIDVAPAEPTPRRSRLSVLREDALREGSLKRAKFPPNSNAAIAIDEMTVAATDLYVEQMLLLGSVEERARAQSKEIRSILAATGISATRILPPAKISNTLIAQGGPFIDANNLSDTSSSFFRHANRAAFAIDELADLENIVARVPLSSPLIVDRRMTSRFGVRRDPINGRNANHHGLDFAAAWASPIVSTAMGTVKFAGTRSGFGRVVEIDHGNGFVTRYAHLNRYTVKAGQKVKLHQKIGELGNSGRSTGPHIHYEIIYKGRPVNPQRFIEAGRYAFES